MNITDIKDNEIIIPSTDDLILRNIFDRQNKLHEKYKSVEFNNQLGLGLVKERPFSIDDKDWQYLIKDFAWRITEELTEAQEAKNEKNHIHCLEELIDALHFYTELLIICGYKAKDIKLQKELKKEDGGYILYPVYNLGIACNLLKNKPWKNTQVITDPKRFKTYLLLGYTDTINCILNQGKITFSDLYLIYMKKNIVNQFRIRSNY